MPKLKLFRDFNECCAILETFFEDLTKNSIRLVKQAIARSESWEERDAIFHVFEVFRTCLWDIPEAVSIGFNSWLQAEIPERKNAMIYHGMI